MELEPGRDESSGPSNIQDAFDSLLLCEDTFVKQGYEEGLADGEKAGFQEGFELGVQKGGEIGAEIAFYRGFAKGWLALLSSDSAQQTFLSQVEQCEDLIKPGLFANLQAIVQTIKPHHPSASDQKAVKVLLKLLALIACFPDENPKDQDVLHLLNTIRAKFKHCCAILKVEASYSTGAQLNF